MGVRCADCLYFDIAREGSLSPDVIEQHFRTVKTIGLCRVRAPHPSHGHPMVDSETDWCGEFLAAPRDEIPTPENLGLGRLQLQEFEAWFRKKYRGCKCDLQMNDDLTVVSGTIDLGKHPELGGERWAILDQLDRVAPTVDVDINHEDEDSKAPR